MGMTKEKGSIKRRSISFLLTAVIAVGTLLTLGNPRPVYGASYLKSVTYFSDAWPINFWNTESTNMEAELAQIAADGFNSIILVIPWREFQPNMGQPDTYTDYAMEKLERIMKSANAQGLMVTARIGYTWDYYDANADVTRRYESIMYSEVTMKAWLAYAETIYRKMSAYENFRGGFITWEDFWNFPEKAFYLSGKPARQRTAAACGYIRYLKQHYSLEELSLLYGEAIKSYESVYIPEKKQPAAGLFYEFYDEFLNDLLLKTQQVFPGLSMEVRLDQDVVYDLEGQPYYYNHSRTYDCQNASYTGAMISVAMGQKNHGEKVSAASGVAALNGYLAHVRTLNGGKPLYMEQFLYMDNTRGFSRNAQIIPEQLPAYITGMRPVLKNHGMGYGIWVYRNYTNNQLYNPQFALDLRGWTSQGNVRVSEEKGTSMAVLRGGSSLHQQLCGDMRGRKAENASVRFRAYSETPVWLEVSLGYEKKSIQIQEDKIYEVMFAEVTGSDLTIESDGVIWLDDIQVYDFVQEGRIYDISNQPMDCLPAFRNLNTML